MRLIYSLKPLRAAPVFKKPQPHGLNGLEELLRRADDSKVRRARATRSLLIELERLNREREETELAAYLKRARCAGAQ